MLQKLTNFANTIIYIIIDLRRVVFAHKSGKNTIKQIVDMYRLKMQDKHSKNGMVAAVFVLSPYRQPVCSDFLTDIRKDKG